MKEGTAQGRPGDRRHQARRPSAAPSKELRTIREDATGIALGSLLVYLVSRPLPRVERGVGWALAQRWLAELIDARHSTRKVVT